MKPERHVSYPPFRLNGVEAVNFFSSGAGHMETVGATTHDTGPHGRPGQRLGHMARGISLGTDCKHKDWDIDWLAGVCVCLPVCKCRMHVGSQEKVSR